MADRGVHEPPYGGVAALLDWVDRRDVEFDVWCAGRGFDPDHLPAHRWCNAVHAAIYDLDQVPVERRDEIHNLLAGPRTTTDDSTPTAVNAVDAEAGIPPPAWWRGDEDAARSGLAVTAR
jgi:hypothetical protein